MGLAEKIADEGGMPILPSTGSKELVRRLEWTSFVTQQAIPSPAFDIFPILAGGASSTSRL